MTLSSALSDFSEWDFANLKSLSERELRYANGFLRANPLRWIGSIKNHWTGVFESLGLESRLLEIKPILDIETQIDHLWGAKINSYPLGLSCEADVADLICSLVAKKYRSDARAVLLDYFGRRFLGTLAMSWNGPALESFVYVDAKQVSNEQWAAAVQVRFEISGQQVSFNLLLSAYLLDILDGLWLRQRLVAAKKQGELTLNLEIADYYAATSDLEKLFASSEGLSLPNCNLENVQLVTRGDNVILGGRLLNLNPNFGVQIISGNKAVPRPSEGQVRVSCVIGQIKINAEKYAEVSQPQAILQTELALSNRVSVFAAGVRYGEAKLGKIGNQATLVFI